MAIPKYLQALANHKDAAIVHAGGMLIPVKIMDIESESTPISNMTTFKAMVVDPNCMPTTELMKSAKAAANSIYGRMGAFPSTRKDEVMGLAMAAAGYATYHKPVSPFEIDHVDFDATATTVFWKDGAKTEIVYQAGNPALKEHDLATAFTLKNVGIKKVIFNNPVTITLWKDGAKTIVRCQEGDTYSCETGLFTCIAKRSLGNKGNFNEVFKKHIPNY